MLDWRNIVQDPKAFVTALEKRGYENAEASSICQKVLDLSQVRVSKLQQADQLKAQRNQLSQSVGTLMREGKKEEAESIKIKAKSIGDEIVALEKQAEYTEVQFQQTLERLPNLPHESTPVGKSEDDNVFVRDWGEKPKFSFEPKSHDEIGLKNGLIDFDRAAKVTGARFVFLKAGLAQLERALVNFMLDEHRARGYEEIVPPYIVNSSTMYGIGQFPKFTEDVYKLEKEDRYLIPTAEVPLTSLYSQEILTEEELPKKFAAFTPCFRSEAGSHGKDTKGLIRQHQFHKVELVKLSRPENSIVELEAMVNDAENILQKLKIAYRVIHLCSADMGANSRKTYDIEVWLPGSVHKESARGCYREISSCSDCGDFQARRSGIRFKGAEFKGTKFVHTLNGSGLAVGRTLVAVVENYQNQDGSIRVPDVLKPYMGGLSVIS